MKKDLTRLRLHTTGNAAFDEILGGGIPERSVTVIAGQPGSGKTILALQTVFHGAAAGKKCLYFTTLSEPAVKLIRYMQAFSFFDDAQIDRNVFFVDLGSAIRKGAEATLAHIESRVTELEPDFVVIDSFRAIGEVLGTTGANRPFVYDLATQMAAWGATTLLVGEYSPEDMQRFGEFAVADGVIHLGSERQELTSVREVEIHKLRGAAYRSGRHFFSIGDAGLSFFPRVRAPEHLPCAAPMSERAKTGIEGLDQLLDGGLPLGSTTVIQGGTGTGKTLVALHFLLEGAARGETGILFTQEETPDQLRSIAQGLGWDLAAVEATGLLHINYTSPVELSTDHFLYDARALVTKVHAKRAVFDSLTTMALGVSSERRFKEMVYAIAKHLRVAGTTLLMTMESEQLLGTAVLSGHGMSFIADNLIQLRYLEMGGRLERAISVLKARGVNLGSELRSVAIGQGGMKVVADRFTELTGVLTGLPTRVTKRP
jgi:circadian clock protein KaiC